MIAVIFEVWPHSDKKEEYLTLAATLRASVEANGGLLSIERFESLYEEGKLLSLQFWESEEDVKRWRNNLLHKEMQVKGRKSLFKNYRLRVANVTRDYSPTQRQEAPKD